MEVPFSLPGPSPPSAAEVEGYYYGLPSGPKLVARTSTTPWRFQQDRWPIHKNLEPVGQHPIANLWNSAGLLQQEILQALGGVSWTAIDILRIGYERANVFTGEEFNHPVTLLISVEADSTPWPLGYTIVVNCRRILERHGIYDIDVEMKESQRFRCAPPAMAMAPSSAPRLSSGPLHKPVDTNALFSEFLGLSIAPFGQGTHEGTKCLYLRRRDTGTVLALTCRHVVFGQPVANEDYRHDDADPRTIIQPGDGTHKEAKESVTNAVNLAEQAIEALQDNTHPAATCEAGQERAEKDAFVQVQKRLGTVDDKGSRIIGHVVFSPKYGTGTSQPGAQHLRDWALIELHPEKHETPLEALDNRVFVSEGARKQIREAFNAETNDRDTGKRKYALRLDEQTHTVLLKGITPEHEMRNQTIDSVSLDEPAMIVAKYGRTTKLTVGVANQVKSVTRESIDGVNFMSEEWCILGHKMRGCGRQPFSARGDSGSCVWDMEGRISAMLTGGTGNSTSGTLDTTYVTPIQWLLDDIMAHGYDVELL